MNSVTPRRHSRQVPQLIWNGTTTRSPTCDSRDGVTDRDDLRYPLMPDRVSGRQRRCARAQPRRRGRSTPPPTGRTSACCGWVISGSATSRQAYRPASSNVSCLIPAFLSDCSSIVNSVPRPDRSRAALIDTAATLFRRQGYAATGLNQILDEAAVKAGFAVSPLPAGKAATGRRSRRRRRGRHRATAAQILSRRTAGGRHRRSVGRSAGRRADRRPARRLPDRADRHRVGPCQRTGARSVGTCVHRLVQSDRRAAARRWLVGGRSGKRCCCCDFVDRGSVDPIPHRGRRGPRSTAAKPAARCLLRR